MSLKWGWPAAALLALAGCDNAPQQREESPAPALWQIESPQGKVEGWLFGTIHALPDGIAWQTAKLDEALTASDLLLVEVADLSDTGAFEFLSRTPASGPLSERVSPEWRDELAQMLRDNRLSDTSFYDVEDWAAALALGQLARDADPGNGVDEYLIKQASSPFGGGAKMPVRELEGAQYQLAIFDRLPAAEQRALLDQAVESHATAAAESARMRELWLAGDIDGLSEIVLDEVDDTPRLYKALMTDRNLAMAAKIEAALAEPDKPFVAVGAAHMIGETGLPKLLAKQGYRVRRIQ